MNLFAPFGVLADNMAQDYTAQATATPHWTYAYETPSGTLNKSNKYSSQNDCTASETDILQKQPTLEGTSCINDGANNFIFNYLSASGSGTKSSEYSTGATPQLDCEAARINFIASTPGTAATACTNRTSILTNTGKIITNVEKDGVGQDTTSQNILPDCIFAHIGGAVAGTSDASFSGCLIQAYYYMFFAPTSYIFGLSGKFFDFTFGYSVNDNSYRASFPVQGWGILRDFCNIFFIFILIWAAFELILDIDGHKAKERIIHVIIIGLLINFSLFATQVMIDTSNILARVFYTSDAITNSVTGGTGVADRNGVPLNQRVDQTDPNELPLSAGIVNQIDPQALLACPGNTAYNDNLVADGNQSVSTATKTATCTNTNISLTTWFLVITMAVIFNVFGIFVFLAIAIIFIGRVIGLWLAMVFAPVAFFSYAVPELQDKDIIGWKKWWPETLKLCFLAPVFIFFLYLILVFIKASFFQSITNGATSGAEWLLGIVIPFVFIMLLLWKAKTIAEEMSGTIGKVVVGLGNKVGGAAVGAVTGGYATLGRATLGRAGNAIANGEGLKRAERKGGLGGFLAKNLRNVGTSAGAASYDARGASFNGKTLASVGVGGKAKEGGFTKMRAENVEKRKKRAQELEAGEDSKWTQNVREKENLLNKAKSDLVTQTAIKDANDKIKTRKDGVEDADKDLIKAKKDLEKTTEEENKKIATREKDLATADKDLITSQKELADINKEVVQGEKDLKYIISQYGANSAEADGAGKSLGTLLSRRDTKQNEVEQKDRDKQAASLWVGRAKTSAKAAIDPKKAEVEQKDRDKQAASLWVKRAEAELKTANKPIEDAKEALEESKNIRIAHNRTVREEYAHTISTPTSNVINFIVSGGQHSWKGEREAKNKILGGIEEEKKKEEKK